MKWSVKIALLYISFATMMIALVIASTFQDFHLVAPDYYAKELAYESRIEAIKNANKMPASIQFKYPAVNIDFQEVPAAGEIYFYRPSNANLDQQFAIATSPEGSQTIDISTLPSGRWELQLAWKYEGKDYYQARDVIIP